MSSSAHAELRLHNEDFSTFRQMTLEMGAKQPARLHANTRPIPLPKGTKNSPSRACSVGAHNHRSG